MKEERLVEWVVVIVGVLSIIVIMDAVYPEELEYIIHSYGENNMSVEYIEPAITSIGGEEIQEGQFVEIGYNKTQSNPEWDDLQ